jgi:hypothetical protein
MTPITAIAPIVNDDPPERCDLDCIYIDGACRCRHGETVPVSFGDPVRDNLVLPF